MKKSFKNQAGAAVIVVIIVILLAVAGGGAAFLGVRMLVTGDPFLQPFEDLGWIELEDKDKDDDEDEDDKEDKKNKKKKDDDEDVDENADPRLSVEAKKAGTDHYYGSMTMADSDEAVATQYPELAKLLKIEIDVYARNDKAVEIVFNVKMTEFMKGMYEEYKDSLVASGYETYEQFEAAMKPTLESGFDMGFSQAAGTKGVNKYNDNGDIQIYVTDEGIDSLYDEFGIDEDDGIDAFIDAIEDSMGMKISKVK